MPSQELVRDYYGRQLSSSADLRTSACCDGAAVPTWMRPLLAGVHPEVNERYYGCGLVCPPLLEGCRVLDLGCGAGRDVYLLSQLVGPEGAVVGVDMTPEQLAVARRHQERHAERFGFANVRFLEGTIEALDQLPLEPGSFDVIVSNCVLNLSTDKAAVLAGVERLLKPGGEFHFADVYADRRLSEAVRRDPVLWGECLGGALYWNDFLRLARQAGFADPRLVDARSISATDAGLATRLGETRFVSATYRLFRIDGLESSCEDHGQAVAYLGTVPHLPERFALDAQHSFETGRWLPVCGNTHSLLSRSRYGAHFAFVGDSSRHFGLFPGCACSDPFQLAATRTAGPPSSPEPTTNAGSCC